MEENTEVVESPQNESLSDVATDALREALSTETTVESDSPEIAESPVQSESEPLGEVSSSSEETEIEETTEESESERLAKRRVRPRSELDQQVIDLYRSSGFQGSFQDASQIIFGANETPQTQQVQAPQPDLPQSDPYEDHITGLRENISKLESEITEATEEMDTTKAMELQRDLFRKELEVQKVQSERQIVEERHRMSAHEAQRQKAMNSREKAVSMYPDLDNKESLYRKEFDHFLTNAEQNPDYQAVFSSPRWAEIMANEFAVMKGQAPVSGQPAPSATAPIPQQQLPQMGNQAKVLTSGQTANPINKPMSVEQVTNNMSSMSKDQLYQALGQPDGRKFLR
jgi:hypothetical protein